MELDLVTANKYMTEIKNLFENSTAEDFVMYDQFYSRMAEKALQIVELYKSKGK
jgi:hypothetical protein